MAKVESVPLSEVAEINPSASEEVLASGAMRVSFVPMSAVSELTGSVVAPEEREVAACRKGFTPFAQGDVLVAKITPCFENGKIVVADIPHRFGFGSTEFHVVRPIPSKLDSRYLLHMLRHPVFRMKGEKRMTGSAGQRRVPSSFLSTFAIPLPPLDAQRRIAAVLDKADALRAKRRAALAQLDTLTQSIFLDMFGDPATNPKGWPLRFCVQPCEWSCIQADGVGRRRSPNYSYSKLERSYETFQLHSSSAAREVSCAPRRYLVLLVWNSWHLVWLFPLVWSRRLVKPAYIQGSPKRHAGI
jgi:hypothetical protein